MRAGLACSALNMAIIARLPSAGLIVHTDQGSQYASDDYLKLLAKHSITASMSGRGNCYDNAVIERFFLNLKMERVWQTHYTSHQEAVKDISQYIVAFYNDTRLHSSLGYLLPNPFEVKLTENKEIMSMEASSFS
jgi:putative transposase